MVLLDYPCVPTSIRKYKFEIIHIYLARAYNYNE